MSFFYYTSLLSCCTLCSIVLNCNFYLCYILVYIHTGDILSAAVPFWSTRPCVLLFFHFYHFLPAPPFYSSLSPPPPHPMMSIVCAFCITIPHRNNGPGWRSGSRKGGESERGPGQCSTTVHSSSSNR